MINEEVTKAFESKDYVFCKGNTCVTRNKKETILVVHGNIICSAVKDAERWTTLYMRHCGYPTQLTAKRLTAVLRAFTPWATVHKEGNRLVIKRTVSNLGVIKEYIQESIMVRVAFDEDELHEIRN